MQSSDCKIFLDVSGLLVELGIGGVGTFDERGLLGVAFHPDYANNGLLYTYTSEPVDGPADFSTIPVEGEADHQTVIREWEVSSPTLPGSVVDPTSSRELLRIDQPQFNHNGGAVNFGPDGMLYISLGDGGSADDQGVGHGTDGNGQNTSNILGALIRIDPLVDNSANGVMASLPTTPLLASRASSKRSSPMASETPSDSPSTRLRVTFTLATSVRTTSKKSMWLSLVATMAGGSKKGRSSLPPTLAWRTTHPATRLMRIRRG